MKKIIFYSIFIALISCQTNNKSTSDIEDFASDTIATSDLPIPPPEKKVDSAKVNELKPLFKFKTDEFSTDKTTWVTPKSAAKYRNMNGLHCYFSNNNLRFVVQFHRDNWLFIKECQFLIDGKPFLLIPEEVKRDNDYSGITEWFDISVDYKNSDLIEALAAAKSAKVKFIGDQYVDIKNISAKEILGVKKTLELFNAMGYSY